MVRRLRDAVAVAEALEASQAPAQVKRTLRMPPRAADSSSRTSARAISQSLRQALAAMADLEVETRGGPGRVLSEDTAAIQAVLTAAAYSELSISGNVAGQREPSALLALPADRGLRLPLRLRDDRPRGSVRGDRVAVPAAS